MIVSIYFPMDPCVVVTDRKRTLFHTLISIGEKVIIAKLYCVLRSLACASATLVSSIIANTAYERKTSLTNNTECYHIIIMLRQLQGT